MLLTLKNKQLMAIDRLIEAAHKQEYAIIDEIEITPAEIFELIREIEAVETAETKHEIRKKFKVSGDGNSANKFEFFALSHDFVDKWKKRVYTVTYREVTLRLVDNIRKPL